MKQRNQSWSRPVNDREIDEFVSLVEEYVEYLEDHDPPDLSLRKETVELKETVENLKTNIYFAEGEKDELLRDVLYHARAISSSLETSMGCSDNTQENEVKKFYDAVGYHIGQIIILVS